MSSTQVGRSFRQPRSSQRWFRTVGLLAIAVWASNACWPQLLSAQEPKANKSEKAAKGDDENVGPEDLVLTTEDGLSLAVTYFPGRKGKESIPVILLHGRKGSRKDFAKEKGLASYLQEKLGCAVVVPDLRGHGESTTFKGAKKSEMPKPEKLQPRHIGAMATQDLRAVKDFLWKKNNDEELNIDKLCLVGVEMGATLALDYALLDSVGYEQNTAQFGPLKLGRFVKAIVMISPEWSVPGLNTRRALTSPEVSSGIAVMILVGKGNSKYLADAERFHSVFAKTHPSAATDDKETRTLWYGPLDASIEGVKLLDEASLNVQRYVGMFLSFRLVKNPDAKKLVWKARKLPHE